MRLGRRYYWCPGGGGGGGGGGGTCPADALLGVEAGRVSPGAREICCRLAIAGDFRQAAADARRVGGLRVCRERLRQLVEAEAAAVTAARQQAGLPASWSAAGTRVYVGVDGVMVPTVTEAEKRKRRASHAGRRAARVRHGKANAKPLPPRRAGTDNGYKEAKVGLFYDQDKGHRHAFVTCGGPEALGGLLRGQAKLVDVERATDKRSVTDAAAWILRQLDLCLPVLDGKLVDFYHLATHVYAAANACLGEAAGGAWALARLHEAKHGGPTPVLAAVDALDRTVRRSPAKREALRQLAQYVRDHADLMDYPREVAAGRDIGSGPTEATCKTLTLRVKGCGMKWDLGHAQDMMNLVAMYESGQADRYWQAVAA